MEKVPTMEERTQMVVRFKRDCPPRERDKDIHKAIYQLIMDGRVVYMGKGILGTTAHPANLERARPEGEA